LLIYDIIDYAITRLVNITVVKKVGQFSTTQELDFTPASTAKKKNMVCA